MSNLEDLCISNTYKLLTVFVKAPNLVPAVEKCILYLEYDRELSYCLNELPSTAVNRISFQILHRSLSRFLSHWASQTASFVLNHIPILYEQQWQMKYIQIINNMSLDGCRKKV